MFPLKYPHGSSQSTKYSSSEKTTRPDAIRAAACYGWICIKKAERVAWRQILRWVQAQYAMIETGMVQPAEVFLAYMVNPATNRTLFDHMIETQFKALPPSRQ
jgi:hypothetical protein